MRESEGYLHWLDDRIRQIGEQDVHLDSTIGGIEERRRGLAEQLAELHAARKVYAQWKPEAAPVSQHTDQPDTRLAAMTTVQALEVVLKEQQEATVRELTNMVQKAGKAQGKIRVFAGGPVKPELGFVVHSPDYRRPHTIAVDPHIAITPDRQILEDISRCQGPA